VKYYVEAESDREIGDGFVPKTDDWCAEVDRADVIRFDDIRVSGPDQREGPGTNERGDTASRFRRRHRRARAGPPRGWDGGRRGDAEHRST
jgi:hypothetical protein